MGQPNWTPDGSTVNVNKTPANHNVGTVALPRTGMTLTIDRTDYSPRARWLILPRNLVTQQVDPVGL